MSGTNSTDPRIGPGVYWTIIGSSNRKGYYLCRCICGTEKEIREDALRKSTSKSCNCKKAEMVSNARKTHGRSKTPLHNIWWAMIERCHTHSTQSYPLYGGRGITVAERWMGPNGFENFLADVGERPSAKHSIDRINSDGNYEPGNVRWSTAAEQSRNRRSNQNYTYNGKTQCLSDWAAEVGMHPVALKYRIEKWGIERAVTTPINTAKGRREKKNASV